MDEQSDWSKVRAGILELAKILDPTAREHMEDIQQGDLFTQAELKLFGRVLQGTIERIRTNNETRTNNGTDELPTAFKLFAMYLIWFSVLYYRWEPAETNVRLLGFVMSSYISFTWIVRSYRWILTTSSLFTDIGSLFMQGRQSALMVKDWILEHIANRIRPGANAETPGDQEDNPGQLVRTDDV